MIKLKWHDEIPDNILEIEHVVQQDLISIHEDLDGECGKLIFHHVFLGEDYNGPLVFVWGEDNDNEYYHCKYDPDPDWKTIEDLQD